ncbi:MAG: ABC transporter permease [bacterium]|nr:ABC transporter permease [bacterium]
MLQSFNLALKSIWGNKMRSFLTMLGIIIGVAAVIILVSLVNGYMSYMTDSFASMGTNRITVNATNISTRSVTADDMYAFFDENSELFEQLSPTVSIGGRVKSSQDTMDATSIMGVSEGYLAILDEEMAAGRFLHYSDVVGYLKVCVLGYYPAVELFGTANEAIDQTVKINGQAYKVVGVIQRQDEENWEDGGSDDVCYLPYSSATKLSRSTYINNYTFTVKDVNQASEAKETIEAYLYTVFKTEDLYSVTAMSEMLDELNSMIDMMSGVLGGIAGISLLVAGVGVMNIMLVSVTERTREIGIRKSLGAKKRTIMTQFVIEAAMTSMIGGLIGIVLGMIGSVLGGNLLGISAAPSMGAILLSFGVSVAIGLIFGYMPANRAAKLNPIDALRSE